jgi:methylated-DNA-[protein]-cysteine S-methyltransferase
VYCVLETPHGPLHAAATADGICGLSLRSTTEIFLGGLARLGLRSPMAAQDAAPSRGASGHLTRLAESLGAYWSGVPLPELPLDLRVGSDWDRRILTAVGTIGHGETLSYGGVAARAGAPRAARAAGGAVGRNPIAILVPCHRVIAGDGSLGGYGGSWFGDREELLRLKRSLLALEGVRIPA